MLERFTREEETSRAKSESNSFRSNDLDTWGRDEYKQHQACESDMCGPSEKGTLRYAWSRDQ